MRRLATVFALILLSALPARAAFDTRASAAYVYDLTSGVVLFEKNANQALPPASMSKLMTLLMLFEAIRDNPSITLATEFPVSARAEAMGGSTMFLDRRDRPTVEDLIKGIIVLSGNDATVVVAEGLAGTEDAFARLMTERARQLGMVNSNFANASGWPHPTHRMSMRDLGILATHLIEDFPEFYTFFALTEWPFDGRSPDNRFNRNPLLRLNIGADGLKTGHTQEAGYGLVGSSVQGGRRVVFVITGLDTEAARAEEAERITNWAFRQFVMRRVVEGETELASAPVWMGAEDSVPLVTEQPVDVLVPLLAGPNIVAEVRFDGPLEAPIAQGTQVGTLVITPPEMEAVTVPLLTAREVARGGVFVRLRTAAKVLMKDVLGAEAEAATR